MRPDLGNARTQAVHQAQTCLAANPVYLDTETTGTGPRDEIIDICLIDHDGRILVDSLVKPSIPIPPTASRIHRITDALVVDAPRWRQVWSQIAPALEGRLLGIYNAAFDLRLMRQSHGQAGLSWNLPAAASFCIMELYAQFYGQWDPHRRSYRWQSLSRAGKQCRIMLPATHRAKDDALLARAVLMHMAGEGSR